MFFEFAHDWSQSHLPCELLAWDLGVFVSPADGLAELVAKKQRSEGGGFAQQLEVVFGVGKIVAVVEPVEKTGAVPAVELLAVAERRVEDLAGVQAEPFVPAPESEACWDGSAKHSM